LQRSGRNGIRVFTMNVSNILNRLDEILRLIKDTQRSSHRVLEKLSIGSEYGIDDGAVPSNPPISSSEEPKPSPQQFFRLASGAPTTGSKVNSSSKTNGTPAPFKERIKELREWLTLIIAVVVAIIYGRQLLVMQNTAKLDERPWVKITADPPKVNVGSQLVSKGAIVNIGKTPATALSWDIAMEIVPSNQEPRLSMPTGVARLKGTAGILYPNDPDPLVIPGLEVNGNAQIVTLGNHPKAANGYHLKSGQRKN
jgi:hypothetical protein